MPSTNGNPTASSRQQKDAGSKKGITMEDLKQQTAERLAKQQESRQRKNSRHQQHKSKSSQSHASHESSQGHGHSTAAQPQPYVPATDHTCQRHSSFESENSSASIYSSEASVSNYSQSPSQGPSSSYQGSAQHSHRSGHKQHDHVKGPNRNISKITSPYVPLKVQRVPAKLPTHGLTVQELKEMTRARLASEATEESGSVNTTPVADDASLYELSRQRVYSHEGSASVRQRIDSSESWRSAPAPNMGRSTFTKARSNSRLNVHQRQQPGLSSFYSADAADNVSVMSGYGGDSYMGSDASGIFTTSSSRDLGRSVSFPAASESTCDYDVYTAVSFETGRARVATAGLTSPALSNLMEDKPFSPSISASFSGEGRNYDFAGLPASPAVHSPFGRRQPVTPSSRQTLSYSDDRAFQDDSRFSMPELPPVHLERQTSRNDELSKHVAESVLRSSNVLADNFDDYRPSPVRNEVVQNPWKKNDSGGISKLESDLNNLLFSGNDVSGSDSFPFASIQSRANIDNESDWTPVYGQPLTPHARSNVENFNDDGDECFGSPDRTSDKASGASSKSGNKKSSRWNFF